MLTLALLAAAPVAARAATQAPGPDSQTFASSSGGWTQSTATGGTCVPALLCPGVTDDWVAGDGVDGAGDGYIRTQFTSVATTVTGTSTGTWQSPAFTYHGNAGKKPGSVALDLDIRPQVSALVGTTLENEVDYRVDVVDVASGVVITAVPTTSMVANSGWTVLRTAHVDPSLLKMGHSYAIRIATSYHSAVAVVGTGEVGYDDVRLTTAGKSKDVNGGSGITSTRQLRTLVTQGLPASATLVGNHLTFRVKSPAAAAPLATKHRLRGLARGKASTFTTNGKFLRIKAGASKVVRLKIRQVFLKKYRHANHVFIRTRVRVGIFKVTVIRRVKLIH